MSYRKLELTRMLQIYSDADSVRKHTRTGKKNCLSTTQRLNESAKKKKPSSNYWLPTTALRLLRPLLRLARLPLPRLQLRWFPLRLLVSYGKGGLTYPISHSSSHTGIK